MSESPLKTSNQNNGVQKTTATLSQTLVRTVQQNDIMVSAQRSGLIDPSGEWVGAAQYESQNSEKRGTKRKEREANPNGRKKASFELEIERAKAVWNESL